MPVIRSHVAGSMLRPPELKEAREKFEKGELAPAAYKRVEDAAVNEAIRVQERTGIEVVSDGEQRRFTFIDPILTTIAGLTEVDESLATDTRAFWRGDVDTPMEEDGIPPLAITEKLRRVASLPIEEFTYARARTDRPIKVTIPSPMLIFMFWKPEISGDVYAHPLDAAAAIAEIQRSEIRELAALGCEHIQVDAPDFMMASNESSQVNYFQELSTDNADVLKAGLEIINSLATEPGIDFGFHLCRGNNQGRWCGEGGYESLSKEVFRGLSNYDSFFLEYDDARSGSFEPLADMPDDKLVVLGIVSSKRKELEDPDELKRRIDAAAQYHPLDRLALSPQCGFASTFYGNPVTAADQEAKLALVSDVARTVWG